MCGRFTLTHTRREVLDHYGIRDAPTPLAPRYNIAPATNIAVVRMGQEGRELRELKWGLVPHWAKEPQTGYSMFNAKAETVDAKPAFRSIFRRRRCLIPADGFYEWKSIGRSKQPYRFTMRGEIFSFAGMWDRWQGPDDQVIESCSIIVADANDLVRPVHDRMPVIIDPVDYDVRAAPNLVQI